MSPDQPKRPQDDDPTNATQLSAAALLLDMTTETKKEREFEQPAGNRAQRRSLAREIEKIKLEAEIQKIKRERP